MSSRVVVSVAASASWRPSARRSTEIVQGTTSGHDWPKSARLLRSADFRFVQRRGRRLDTRDLIFRFATNRHGQVRIGITVSRRVGNAVVRNQVKRWLREVVRHRRRALDGVDVVIIARPSAARAGLAPLEHQVERALKRISEHA